MKGLQIELLEVYSEKIVDELLTAVSVDLQLTVVYKGVIPLLTDRIYVEGVNSRIPFLKNLYQF